MKPLEKTRIVYCKDSRRKGDYENIKFDFLGYTFKPRKAKSKLVSEGETHSQDCGVRPAVYLKSDIQLSYDSDTEVYTIIEE